MYFFIITTLKTEFMGNEEFTFLKEKTNNTKNQLFAQQENKNQIIIFPQYLPQFFIRNLL